MKILLFTEFSKSCNLASSIFSMFECIFGIDKGLDFGEIIITR